VIKNYKILKVYIDICLQHPVKAESLSKYNHNRILVLISLL